MYGQIFEHVDCVFTYNENILIFTDDSLGHIKDVDNYKILYDNNLKISILISFHLMLLQSSFGVKILALIVLYQHKILLVHYRIPPPPPLKESMNLCSFLGIVNFYNKLIPDFTDIVMLLTEKYIYAVTLHLV